MMVNTRENRKGTTAQRRVIEQKGGMRVPATIYTDTKLKLEPTAIRQLCAGASLPGVRQVVGTPDIHQGYGVPIGCVLGMDQALVPAAAGFDINCGMQMLLMDRYATGQPVRKMAEAVSKVIPLGEGKHNIRVDEKSFKRIVDGGLEGIADLSKGGVLPGGLPISTHQPDEARSATENGGRLPADHRVLTARAVARGIGQLATLGGGNHFIEFQVVDRVFKPETARNWGVEKGRLVLMIHSGSRGFGHEIASRYMKGNRLNVLDPDSTDGRMYRDLMGCAANFAYANRFLMAALVKSVLGESFSMNLHLLYDVSHNIIAEEDGLYVHRKGATRAFGPSRMKSETGQVVLIPGSMGTASYILEGRDESSQALHSVNHGAGRVMGRREALGVIRKGRVVRPPGVTESDFRKAMAGVELICENSRTIREEAPQAYKDIEVVTDVVTHFGLADRVARLRPLAVLKG